MSVDQIKDNIDKLSIAERIEVGQSDQNAKGSFLIFWRKIKRKRLGIWNLDAQNT